MNNPNETYSIKVCHLCYSLYYIIYSCAQTMHAHLIHVHMHQLYTCLCILQMYVHEGGKRITKQQCHAHVVQILLVSVFWCSGVFNKVPWTVPSSSRGWLVHQHSRKLYLPTSCFMEMPSIAHQREIQRGNI